MADVLLARVDGIEGFERHVVIKRIKSEQARDARFVQMFVDEARLAASLHHHNIVTVHDIGQEDGEYFFAMEYVHGEDLRKFLNHMVKRDQLVPYDHCVTIALNVAAALHHAHEHRGLGIVHRDVSPSNIVIGYDGNVKVVDFGVATIAQRTAETQSRELKGKIAYMSPEQCRGQAVDRRSDIFCLGIVLYELVTVRRLFKEDNDLLTMAAITRGAIRRPSELRPDIAPALEAIILKALAANANDRFQTAHEMRAALEQFAASAKLQTSTTALADYMRAEFGDRPVPWLAPDEDELEMTIDVDGSGSGITGAPPLAGHATTASGARSPYGETSRRRRKRGWVFAGSFVALAVIVGVAVSRAGDRDQPSPPVVIETPAPQPAVAPRPPEPLTPPNLVPTAAAADLRSAPTVDTKPLKKRPPKNPPKGVWDPKALLPPK